MWNRATDKSSGLTKERVRELFNYNPETGILTRNITTAPRAQIGAVAGCLNKSDGYLVVNIDHHVHKRLFQVHRIIWLWMTGEWPECQIDHKNRNRSDNRWSNLRLADNGQNTINQNLRKDNTTGIKGVTFDKKRNQYRVRIHIKGREYMVGRFSTLEKAKEARLLAEKEFYGEYANRR